MPAKAISHRDGKANEKKKSNEKHFLSSHDPIISIERPQFVCVHRELRLLLLLSHIYFLRRSKQTRHQQFIRRNEMWTPWNQFRWSSFVVVVLVVVSKWTHTLTHTVTCSLWNALLFRLHRVFNTRRLATIFTEDGIAPIFTLNTKCKRMKYLLDNPNCR